LRFRGRKFLRPVADGDYGSGFCDFNLLLVIGKLALMSCVISSARILIISTAFQDFLLNDEWLF